MLKSKIFIIPIILGLMAVCFGCNKPEPAPPQQVRELKLAVPSWYSPEKFPPMQKHIDDWNAKHPERPVRIEVLFGKKESLRNKIALSASQKSFADAALVRNEWLGRLVESEAIRPFPVEQSEIVTNAALPGLLPALKYKTRLLAIPFDVDFYLIWARKDKVPWDTLDLSKWNIEALKKGALQTIKSSGKEEKIQGFGFPGAQAANTGLEVFAWYQAFGGRIYQKSAVMGLDAKVLAAALKTLQGLVTAGASPKDVVALEGHAIFNGLAGGRFAMTVGGSWGRGMLDKKSNLSDQIIAMPMPGPDSSRPASLLGGWSFVLMNQGDFEITDFLMELFQEECQREKLVSSSLLPVQKSLLADPWFRENPDGPAFARSLKSGRAMPLHLQTDKLCNLLSESLAKVLLKNETPEKAAEEAVMKMVK